MNQRQAKTTRRMMRRYFRDVGLTPEALAEKFALQLQPKPRWCPLWVWVRVVKRVVKAPPSPTKLLA